MVERGHIVIGSSDYVRTKKLRVASARDQKVGDPAGSLTPQTRDRPSQGQDIAGIVSGANVLTDRGRREVSGIDAGDKIWTLGSGLRTIRSCTCQTFAIAPKTDYLRPVSIAANALGDGKPITDIQVAPGQRLLLNDWRIQTYFDVPEVLVTAGDLVGHAGIAHDDGDTTFVYCYPQFQNFELIALEGLIVESIVRDRNLSLFSSSPLRNSRSLPPSRPLLSASQAEILKAIRLDAERI